MGKQKRVKKCSGRRKNGAACRRPAGWGTTHKRSGMCKDCEAAGAQPDTDNSRHMYRPPEWAWRLVGAYLDVEIKPTVSARCKSAGINRDTFYENCRKPEFVGWLNRVLSEAVSSDTSDVRQAHLKECLKGSLEAIKLWYERYGDFVPTQRQIIEGDIEVDAGEISNSGLDQIARILAAESKKGTGSKVH